MRNNIFQWLSLITLACLLASCGSKQPGSSTGKVTFLVGDAVVEQSGKTVPLHNGDTIGSGDIVRAAHNCVLILSIGGTVDVEIQPDTSFKLDSLNATDKTFFMEKGNAWLRLNGKLAKKENVTLRTLTTTAAVRGTKFYTFHLGDMVGTCFCQGEVAYRTEGSESFQQRKQDYLTFVRGGKTILFTPVELKGICDGAVYHRHSMIDNSPLGERDTTLTPAKLKKLRAIAEARFEKL